MSEENSTQIENRGQAKDPRCRIEMLGPLRLVRSEQIQTRFGTQKAAALLTYLALRPGPHPRERLIDLFWPDMDLPAGRNNLSTALAGLRRVLEPPGVRKGDVLVTSYAAVGLNPTAVTTDVGDFERLLEKADIAPDTARRAALREQALVFYIGDFASGYYQDWAIHEAERLSSARVTALDGLSADLEALGRVKAAAEWSRRLLEADPYTEKAHVGLIRRLALSGQIAAAREAWRHFQQFFEEEFGSGPSAAARQAADDAISQTLSVEPISVTVTLDHTVSRPVPVNPVGDSQDHPTTQSPLPFWLSRFFGREAEMADLSALLLPPKGVPDGPTLPRLPERLVTLTGPGGNGKTRLAAEFARLAVERLGQRCGFAALADITAATNIPAAIAAALRLIPSPNTPPLEQVLAFFRLGDRPGRPSALLVLDNLEHLLDEDECRTVLRTLLEGVPDLSLLCTSRQRVGLQGEKLFPLGPLPIPEVPPEGRTSDATLAVLADVPSVRLYLDRAQAVRPNFGLTAVNAGAVVELCRALEGSPLALELAAAWVRALPPRAMWERLSQGQSIPEGRHTDLPGRHRSLPAALEWSWRLLTERQRRFLARLSVFRGGWTADAAGSVCEESDPLNQLSDLEDASLVTSTEAEDGGVRYRLLETVRQFAGEKLTEGADETPAARHAAWFLTLAEMAQPELTGPEGSMWLTRLEADHDNLRTALAWYEQHPSEIAGNLRLAAALSRFWTVRGHVSEGRRWLNRALARIRAGSDGGERQTVDENVLARALLVAGGLANTQGDFAEARSRLEESLFLCRRQGDQQGIAASLNSLGNMAYYQGDYAAAWTIHSENLTIARERGDPLRIGGSLMNLGSTARALGDYVKARQLLEEGLTIARGREDLHSAAILLTNLGNVAYIQGDYIEAQVLHDESRMLREQLGDQRGMAISLNNLGDVATKQGDYEQARVLYGKSLMVAQRLSDLLGVASSLEGMAGVTQGWGQCSQAARLLGASCALRRTLGSSLPPAEQQELDARTASMCAVLGEEAFAAAWAGGEATNWEQAVEQALAICDPG